MYHLLIERVSIVTSGLVRVRIGLNRTSIKQVVEWTSLFRALPGTTTALSLLWSNQVVSRLGFLSISNHSCADTLSISCDGDLVDEETLA
jgi:hypothetical protein